MSITNEEKARELADCCPNCTFSCGDRLNCKTQSIYNKLLQMAEWKDEQHEQSLIDLNCKLDEQQANYEEIKKRYDEAVEREKIATKIINELRTKLNNK